MHRSVAAALRRTGTVVTTAARRVRVHGPSLLLAATAAGLAFLVAGALFGPQNAVFAPVAAVVATGLSAGQRVRRATEISVGVVLGVLAADVLTRWLGTGPWQLAVAVLLAMAAAVTVRPSGLLANQAAVAAVVVVALVPYLDTGPWIRFGDALVGGVVAVVLNAVAAPDPHRAARAVTGAAVGRLAAVVGRVGAALTTGSLAEAEAALEDAGALDGVRGEIVDALAATRERVTWRPSERRGRRAALEPAEGVAARVAVMVSTTRGLCRAAANLVRHAELEPEPRAGLAHATEELVGALDELRRWVEGAGRAEVARRLALDAATTASTQLPGHQARTVFVGQLRSAAVDVLRATGIPQAEAVAALEAAAGRADDLGR